LLYKYNIKSIHLSIY